VIQSAQSLLLLVPAYNEEKRVGPVLRDYAQFFREKYSGRFQLVVVLNGCVDNTLGVVRAVSEEYPEVTYVEFPGRIGKGGALIEGLRLGPDADLIGYVDADGATAPAAYLELVKRCGEYDCVIGSRWMPGSVLHQAQSLKRRIASRGFHALVELLFGMHIRDTQCGAKVMKRAAAQQVHPFLTIADMAFDINLLYVLKRAGFSVLEMPTEWADKMGSKITWSKGSLAWFLSVVRLRLIYSPFYKWLRPLRPLETWVYLKLGAPPPIPSRKPSLELNPETLRASPLKPS
jgi:glycosyltransferase involved in cell wall biosynthesis